MSSGRNSTISQPTIAIAIPLLNVDYRHFAVENRPPAIPMTRCWLKSSDDDNWKIATIERRREGSQGHQVRTESTITCTWLSTGFLLKDDSCHWNEWEKSTFFTEMAGAKALWLSTRIPKARASSNCQFPWFPLVSYRSFWRIFAKIAKINYLYTFG